MDTISVSLQRVSPASTEASMGRHKVWIDRPLEKGGEDKGPMGGQLFLASIGGCFMSNLLAVIRARDAKVSHVSTEVTGKLAGSPPSFIGIQVVTDIGTANRAEAQKLLEIADRGCIMMNTLRGKLDLSVRLADS